MGFFRLRRFSLSLIEENNAEETFVYQTFDIVSVNRIVEGQVIPGPQLSPTSVMMINEILKYEFDPGRGLGVSLHGMVCPIYLNENMGSFGLGFEPTAEDLKKAKGRKKETWSLPHPVPLLSNSFIKDNVAAPIEFGDKLVDDFQNLFIKGDMVEVGEGTSKADV